MAADAGALLRDSFHEILGRSRLSALYQPIVDLRSGALLGYEGLVRGPADSPLHMPVALFGVARLCGNGLELERACCALHLNRFEALGLAGRLFLNLSPDALISPLLRDQLRGEPRAGLPGVVIELTESEAPSSYDRLRRVVQQYRRRGLELAIDDLGEGFSSLRLWSELRPEFVKIDKYFVRGLDGDPVKRRFLVAMCDLARQSRASVIAEGIETESELAVLRSLGIPFGQGYLLGRPVAVPSPVLAPALKPLFTGSAGPRPPKAAAPDARDGGPSPQPAGTQAVARRIMRAVPAVAHSTSVESVYECFKRQDDLQLLAVLRENRPIGLIHRLRMLERYARPYHRELYGGKACVHVIEHEPLVVDEDTSLQDLGHLVTEANPQHLSDGFIVTGGGLYLGVVTGHDLLREITRMQLDAARYANPLTQLPGNVPIDEHVDALLAGGERFVVCHVDLDRFKPFNDLYGYRVGDQIIKAVARLLSEQADPAQDFVGHIGGDDFIVIFRSEDWHRRCLRALEAFPAATRRFYRAEHLRARGYATEDRQGQVVFHELVGLSLGVVRVPAGYGGSGHQIAESATAAKHQAKCRGGNTLFVERRMLAVPGSSPPEAGASGVIALAPKRGRDSLPGLLSV